MSKIRTFQALLIGIVAFAVMLLAQTTRVTHDKAAPDKKDPHYQSKGDQRRSYKFAETGESLPYRLYVPSSWTPRTKLPLVMVLHGGGLDQDAPFDRSTGELAGLLVKQAEQHKFLVASPSAYKGTNYPAQPAPAGGPGGPPGGQAGRAGGPPPPEGQAARGAAPPQMSPEERAVAVQRGERDILNVVELVVREYNVDRSRIYIMGNSAGGGATWNMGARHPELFAAIAPTAAGGGGRVPFDQLRGIPIICVNGEKDALSKAESARETTSKMKAAGLDITYVEVPGGEHGTAWVMALPQIFDFFAAHTKK